MKKIGTILLTLCLLATLLVLPGAVQAETRGVMLSNEQVYTGPSDNYGILEDVTLNKNDAVTVRTQYWNGSETWVQVEFGYYGALVRGYVPAEAVSANLGSIPVEAPLCAGTITLEKVGMACGPRNKGYWAYEGDNREGISCLVYEVEDGFAHVEYWNFELVKKRRAWVALEYVKADMAFSFEGYYGVAEDEETSLFIPTPTAPPSTYFGDTDYYPVGVTFTVVAGGCNVREDASEDAEIVGYAFVGQRYEILDCYPGDTASGKDWYLIKQGSVYGWISSGLVSLDR